MGEGGENRGHTRGLIQTSAEIIMNIEPAPATPRPYTNEELALLTPRGLLDILARNEGFVARNVLDECASRGDAMLDEFDAFLVRAMQTKGDTESSELWLPLHAAHTLGLMDSARSADTLLAFMQLAAQPGWEDLADALLHTWKYFVYNKPASIIPKLRELAMKRDLGEDLRIELLDLSLVKSHWQDSAALEETLDWLARAASDQSESWAFRKFGMERLLDYPRERFRTTLDDFARKHLKANDYLSKSLISKVYAQMSDIEPDTFARDPWDAYDPDNVFATGDTEEDDEELDELTEDDIEKLDRAPDDEFEAADIEYANSGNAPLVISPPRTTPKVGRNDPCPCGSGKKYKRCCLNKAA